MTNANLIHTLLRKKIEIEEEITSYQNKINKLNSQLNTLVDTVAIFNVDPNKSPDVVRYFKHFECQDLVFKVLKKYNRPMTTTELSEEIQKIKKLELVTKQERLNFSRSFSRSLKDIKRKDLIEVVGQEKRSYIWQIKPIEKLRS